MEWTTWRYFVPDVAYLSYDRLPAHEREAAQEPQIAPDVAVKVDVYLRAGTSLVILLDPVARTCVLHDAERETILAPSAILTHDALPGFAFDLGEAFAQLDA